MKDNWSVIPFEKAICKVKYTKKIANSEYLSQGLFPIISQEDDVISGYWNNKEDVFSVTSPVVIFGDHTRVLKYVDFDFVLGADGVKILLPTKGLDAKFFMYYLNSCKIPSLGYSRHYKLLKELKVPVPPLEEQSRIVEEFDQLSKIIEKKRQQLSELDNLAQSIFYDMFGDPVTNEKGFPKCTVGDIYKFQYGKGNKIPENKGDYPCYGSNGIVGFHTLYNSEDAPIIGHIGAYAGIVNWGTGKHFVTYNGVICKLKDDRFNTVYGYYMLKNQNYMEKVRGGAAQPFVSYDLLESPKTIIPPLNLQQLFAQKIEAIEKEKELIKQSIKETEELFNSRMDYYFG
ncbi:MAG: restriction endonuclease subunit S [Bacteroides sp.]|nr:restriction endonuclease subunit S [Bacteroides sp.]